MLRIERRVIMNFPTSSLPINIGFEKIKDEHTLYQLVPDATIDNVHCSEELVKALHQVKKDLKSRIKRNNMKFSYHQKDVTSYEIFLSKEQIKFTLAIPTKYDAFIQNKVKTSWKNVALKESEDYIHVFENDESLTCDLELENHFFMSLLTDSRTHAPLSSILNVTHGLVDDDKLLFQLLLSPIGNWWHGIADNKYEAYRQGKDVTSSTNPLLKIYIWLYENVIDYVIELIEEIFESILGLPPTPKKTKKPTNVMRGTNAIKTDKTMYEGFNARVRLFSYSQDETRRRDNLNSLIVAFRTLDGDNALKPTDIAPVIRIKREVGRYSFLFPQVFNLREVQQIVTLPNRTMQKEYKQLKAISTKQSNLPKDAFDNKGILIGSYNLKGEEKLIYFSSKQNDIAQSKALICKQGGGKTTYMQNYIYEAYKKNQCVVVIDHIQGCELTNEIIPYISKDRLVVLNLKELISKNEIKGLGYNEVYDLLSSDNPRERVNGANRISTQLTELLNSITLGATETLSSQMVKYLSSACRVVYSVNKDSSIMDVYYCLEDVETRKDYIEKALSGGFYTSDHVDIKTLKYLSKKEKDEEVTRLGEIRGVLSRFSSIQALDLNIMELFSNRIDTSIDFNKYFDEKKIVFVQIPQTEFENDIVRDIMTTFFCTKLWLACQTRPQEKLTLTHLVLDEVSMIPSTNNFLAKYITSFRRHCLSTLFACHNLAQFKTALSNINSSGLNFIIMGGVKHEAIKAIEDDLVDFDSDDIVNLKSRHAIVSTTYDDERVEFMVKLFDKFYKRKAF